MRLRFVSPVARLFVMASLGVLCGSVLVFLVVFNPLPYLGNSPEMCGSCHVMTPEYDSWRHGVHKDVVCSECHLPHENPARKYAFKARDGLWDAWVYFTRSEPQVITLEQRSEPIVRDNCLRCHEDALAYVEAFGGLTRECFDCHEGIAHPGPGGLTSTPYATNTPPQSLTESLFGRRKP